MNNISYILNLIAKAPSESARLELINLFFTSDEISQLEKRSKIIQGLINNRETQRELAARLKISIAKITRGSHALKRVSPELKNYCLEAFRE
jgi:TrpR family transcriptional regulator, trp operon repressor